MVFSGAHLTKIFISFKVRSMEGPRTKTYQKGQRWTGTVSTSVDWISLEWHSLFSYTLKAPLLFSLPPPPPRKWLGFSKLSGKLDGISEGGVPSSLAFVFSMLGTPLDGSNFDWFIESSLKFVGFISRLERERLEAERLRSLTEDEWRMEAKNNPKQVTNKAIKGKYKFLQKYYHRGAFFMVSAHTCGVLQLYSDLLWNSNHATRTLC